MPFDRTDLAEALGNLLDNATRHASSRASASRAEAGGRRSRSRMTARASREADRAAVLARGIRLDQRGEGAGLGLAIVQDVLDAYGWTLGSTPPTSAA